MYNYYSKFAEIFWKSFQSCINFEIVYNNNLFIRMPIENKSIGLQNLLISYPKSKFTRIKITLQKFIWA